MTNTPTNNGGHADNRLTLLHTSDLHVGSGSYPKEALEGFDAILGMARSASVDGVLIAGDLFDRRGVAAKLVSYVFESLAALNRPVVILPGNHDTLITSNSHGFDEPLGGVHVINNPAGGLVQFEGLGLSVWGRAVHNHEPAFHPLEGLPPRPNNGWYVAIGHGIVLEGPSLVERGSPITPQELAEANCDYIALGHTHVFRDVTRGPAQAFYSGAPSGGTNDTAAIVTLEPRTGVSVKAVHIS